MVVEYIRYKITHDQHTQFESAWTQSQPILDAAPECVSYEVTQGVEDHHSYIVRIEWTSVEGHEQGFRKSPGFQQFFALVKPFFEQIEEMRHYQPTPIASAA